MALHDGIACMSAGHSVLLRAAIIQRIVFNMGHHCTTYFSHLHFTHLALVQCLSFVYNLTQQCSTQRFTKSTGPLLWLVYFHLDSVTRYKHWHAGWWIHSGIETLLIEKDCLSLSCEKVLLIREKSIPLQRSCRERRRTHRESRWSSLCEC